MGIRSPWSLAVLALVVAMAGCADRDGITPGAKPVEPSSLGLRDGGTTDWPAEQWWRRYREPALDALVERALADGPTVAVAAARLARAESAAAYAEANRAPQVTGAVDVTRQRYSENGITPKPLAGTIATANVLALNASWELDLFGRNRAALDAALGAELAKPVVSSAANAGDKLFQRQGAKTQRGKPPASGDADA